MNQILQVQLMNAAMNGHLAVVERLLQNPRVDPSARGTEAIIYACYVGQLAVAERLLQDSRVDPNALHRSNPHISIDIEQFSEKSLMILSNKLVFPADSPIIRWKPRIDKYREELFAIADDLTVVLDKTLDNSGLQRNVWETVYEYLEHKLPEQ